MPINMEELATKGEAKKEERHKKSISEVVEFIKLSIKNAISHDKNSFILDLDQYDLAKSNKVIKNEWYCHKIKIGYKYRMIICFRNCDSERSKNRKSIFADFAFATFLLCIIGVFGFILL